MKRLLFGFVIGLLLGNVIRARAQEGAPQLQVETHPQHDLTVQELIEVIASFDVIHVKQQPFFMPAYGVTNFDSNPPAIWIFDGQPHYSKLSTAIHEVLHVRCAKDYVDCSEAWVASEEIRQYQLLFGIFSK